MSRIGLLIGLAMGSVIASIGDSPFRSGHEPYRDPPPPRRKPIGPSGPVIDTTPLTKREKRKLRRNRRSQ